MKSDIVHQNRNYCKPQIKKKTMQKENDKSGKL